MVRFLVYSDRMNRNKIGDNNGNRLADYRDRRRGVHDINEHGGVPEDVHQLVWAALRSRGGISGAALVRYLTLKGFKGVTLVDADLNKVEPSARRDERVHGIAWAPDDASSPDYYVYLILDEDESGCRLYQMRGDQPLCPINRQRAQRLCAFDGFERASLDDAKATVEQWESHVLD